MEIDPNMTLNMTDILASNSSDLEEEPWSYLDMAWTTAFSLIVTISLVGNCLVIWIVTGEQQSTGSCSDTNVKTIRLRKSGN